MSGVCLVAPRQAEVRAAIQWHHPVNRAKLFGCFVSLKSYEMETDAGLYMRYGYVTREGDVLCVDSLGCFCDQEDK